MNPIAIGDKLRELRGDKTLESVSLDTGLSVSALSNYEQGIRIPRDEAKLILARYYCQTVESIFFTE